LKYLYNGFPSLFAAACAKAIDTPKIAFAPSFDFVSVPSRAISAASRVFWVNPFLTRAFLIVVFTFSTALSTPFPR
jgi:hypothetical protein